MVHIHITWYSFFIGGLLLLVHKAEAAGLGVFGIPSRGVMVYCRKGPSPLFYIHLAGAVD